MSEQEFFTDNQQPGAPKISESGISYYKSLLDNTAWCEANPAQANLLKASVDGALAATGQSLQPPADARSPAQKLGAYEREAAEIAKATQALNDAKARMSETALSIAPLLPRQLRTGAKPWDQLVSPLMVNQLALLEAYRLDPRAQKPDRLANHYDGFIEHRTGRVKPIGEIVGELSQNLKADFERCGLPAPTAPQDTPAPLQTAAPETRGIVVDLRGVDLGVPKAQPAEATEESAEQFCEQVAKEVTADA